MFLRNNTFQKMIARSATGLCQGKKRPKSKDGHDPIATAIDSEGNLRAAALVSLREKNQQALD